MRSNFTGPNTVGNATDYNTLVDDAAGSARLLAHQMLGYFTLSTNPTNTKTLTLDINGTNVVITFVSSIGSTPGNVLIGGSAAVTCANLLNLLLNPTVTNANQVAIGTNTAANVTLVNYLDFSLVGTTLYIHHMNTTVTAPLTSFSGSTTATSDSYTAQTMALFVQPGVVYINGTEVYFAGGITPTVTAPSSHPRIDVLTIDNTGTLAWTAGSENVSPSAPTYPSNKLPICELYNVTGETILNDNANQAAGTGYIYNDVRPFLAYPIPITAVPDSILPAADATYNLGSASFQWETLYVKNSPIVGGNPLGPGYVIGGTGTDGAFSISSGTTTIAFSTAAIIVKNYTSISITGTAVLNSSGSNAGGRGLVLKSQGNVTLTSSATPMIDMSGVGAPGSAGTTGGGFTATTATTSLYLFSIAAFGTSSNAPVSAAITPASSIFSTTYLSRYLFSGMGSGGQGGEGQSGTHTGGQGGNGAGTLIIECGGSWNFTTTGGISCNGTNAGNPSDSFAGGGGGGGGGCFYAVYVALTANSGTATASGGAASTSSGGTGGGGGSSTINIGGTVSGGNGGTGANGLSLIIPVTLF